VREQALVRDQGQKGVFIVRDKDAAGNPILNEKKQPILAAIWRTVGTPGVIRDGYVEIQEGIKADDRVVVSGMQRLRNGRAVKPEKYEDPVGSEASTKESAPKPASGTAATAVAAPNLESDRGAPAEGHQSSDRPPNAPTALQKQAPPAARSPSAPLPVKARGLVAPKNFERNDSRPPAQSLKQRG
jgi:hypothetical protein